MIYQYHSQLVKIDVDDIATDDTSTRSKIIDLFTDTTSTK